MRRALVIGGSLGGLLAAHLLRREGWDVTVFERNADDLTGRGAGVRTHPQLLAILAARRHRLRQIHGGSGSSHIICLDHERTHLSERERTARTMSSWGRLYRSLRDPLPPESYRLGMPLTRVEQDAAGVTAVFDNGSRAQGDLLVGADGMRSTVREQLLPGIQPHYAGYVAWRAMLDESEVPPDIRAEIFERYTFCLPEGELFLAYPVPGRFNKTQLRAWRRQHRLLYRPTEPDTALVDLCTDAAGRGSGSRNSPAVDPAGDLGRNQGNRAQAGRTPGRGNLRAHKAAILSTDFRLV